MILGVLLFQFGAESLADFAGEEGMTRVPDLGNCFMGKEKTEKAIFRFFDEV